MSRAASPSKEGHSERTATLSKTAGAQQDSTKPVTRNSTAETGAAGNGLRQKAVTKSERRNPMRSRIMLAYNNRLPPRNDNQSQVVAGSSNSFAAGDRDEKATQGRAAVTRPFGQLGSVSKSAASHEGPLNDKKSDASCKAPETAKAADGDAPSNPAAFQEAKRFDSHPNSPSFLKSPVVTDQPNPLNAISGSAQRTRQNSSQQNVDGVHRPAQSAGQRPRQPSAGKGSLGDKTDTLPNASVSSSSPPTQTIDQELHEAKQFGEAVNRSSSVARASGSHPSVTRPGYVLDSHMVTGDAVTTDTRDNISRGRLSAQVLRGIIGNGGRKQGGTPKRQTNNDGMPNSNSVVIRDVNPLHHETRERVASDSDRNIEMHYGSNFDYGDGVSFTQSSDTQIDVHVGDLDGANTFGDEQSLANRRGELEWLRTPSLFFFFANVIKWNELQLQRRALMSSWQAHQLRASEASLSLISVWTQHRERELRTLEDQISFSASELRGVYLNRLLMRWSKPKLRTLVADVVTTWKKERPGSAKFDSVSSRLFDAISSEATCQLRCTWVFSVRQWLGRPQHCWAVSGMFIACFVVSILCIVFLALFGRTHEIACITLSAVLGIAVILMYVLAMFVLHHNTYAAAAETFYRELAVRAAQQKMEEEELEDVDNLTDVNSYLGGNGEKYGGSHGRGVGGLVNSDETDTHSDYTAEQTSLAVRNLRALTEGNPLLADSGTPYYRISDKTPRGRRESGTASGGYYCDDMTLTDNNAPSLRSRPLQVGDAAKRKQHLDHDNTLLLSTVTYEQHQHYMKQRQSLLVQETMRSPKARNDVARAAVVDPSEGHTNGKEQHVSGSRGEVMEKDKEGDDGAVGSTGMRQLAELPEKVSITVLIYCSNANVLSEVALLLWERMFILLRVADLHTLDSAFKHGSERFKAILIHASDAPDGSEVLRTALMWLQVERRPVFFIARQANSYANLVPSSVRLKVPFSSTAINTLFLAGIGVEPNLGSLSHPVLLQQEQSPSQPFQAPPYVLGRRLGGGAFGNVFEAEMEQFGVKCAVKRMYLKEDSDDGGHEEQGGHSKTTANNSVRVPSKGEMKPTSGEAQSTTKTEAGEVAAETASNADTAGASAVGSQLREIAQEVEIMSSLQHPNIVRYYFCERDDNCISIFMELCTGGSLSSLIHSGKLVNPPEIKLLLREIVSAVAYLHSLRIVHRDLKPDNVMFREGHVKITDFGTAVHKHGGDLRLIKGTFAYMAPETLVGEPYGNACDVWSIGCIAAEVLSVDLPQHALGLPAMCEYYRTMAKDGTLPIECDVPGVRDFLLACLRRDPCERSTAAELFYHPILQARDTSIQLWMQKVVERRRHKYILQHKMSHRIGPGARGNGGSGSVRAGPNSLQGSNVGGRDNVDHFNPSSGNGSIISLDSSRLSGHADSVLTP